MKSILATPAKPRLSAVLPPDPQEMQALEEFIALKERQKSSSPCRRKFGCNFRDGVVEGLHPPNRDQSGATILPFGRKR